MAGQAVKIVVALCVWLQASYHGFGIIVKAEKLVQGHGKPLQEALQHVLADSFYKVSNYPMQRVYNNLSQLLLIAQC